MSDNNKMTVLANRIVESKAVIDAVQRELEEARAAYAAAADRVRACGTKLDRAHAELNKTRRELDAELDA